MVPRAKLLRVSTRIGIGESIRYLRKHNDFVTRFLQPGRLQPGPADQGSRAGTRRSRAKGRGVPHLHVQRPRGHRGVAAAEAGGQLSGRYDFVIVGGGSAGMRARQPAQRRPREPRPRARGRAARLPVGRLHPHARRRWASPIGNRLLRLEVRVRARAAHERTAGSTTRAARCSAARSSINGMIFQRGQPARLRALGGGHRHGDWDYAHCLPVLQADGDAASRAQTSSAATTGRSCSSAALRRTRCSTPSSRRSSRPATR